MPEWLDNLYAARAIEAQALPEERNKVLAALYEEYGNMIADIWAEEGAGRITSERAARLLGSVQRHLEKLSVEVPAELRQGVERLAGRIGDSHAGAVQAASAAADTPVDFSFAEVPDEALRNIMRRRGLGLSDTYRSLVGHWTNVTRQQVDQYVTSAVGRGVSARRGAKELASLLAGENERLRPFLPKVVEPALDEIATEALEAAPDASRLLHRAETIIVSETNTANDEAHRVAASRSPVVRHVRWQLSGRHASIPTSPDICDIYRNQDLYGLGAGVYRPENKPALPHPRCACRVTFITRDPKEWDNDLPPPPPPGDPPGLNSIRNMLQDRGGDPTFNKAVRIRDEIADQSQRAHQVWSTGARGARRRSPDEIPDFDESALRMSGRREAAEFADGQQDVEWEDLTQDQRNAAKIYKEGAQGFNQPLRRRGLEGEEIDPKKARIISNLDDAIESTGTTDDRFITFRGEENQERYHELLDAMNDGETGQVVTHHGYSSTTLDERVANRFALDREGRIMWEIDVPEDSEGMFYEGAFPDDISSNMREAEFVLPRKAQLYIHDITEDEGGRLRVKATFLGTTE